MFDGILSKYESPRQHELVLEFYPYAHLKHTLYSRNGQYRFRVSDIMLDAPREALRAVAHILFSEIENVSCPAYYRETYEEYTRSPEVEEKMESVRKERGFRRVFHPRGKHHDLRESFDRVNRMMFAGQLELPRLTWTQSRVRGELGSYDSTFDLIAISRRMDARRVPQYVLDAVMYHEVLHRLLPMPMRGKRRVVHTEEFNRRERRFPHYKRAVAWLKNF
jgi:hypothetical protein